MEKMNQVSVSEFFAKSKEEMYDMAVEMVEKYNRLVDICNDSAERMADLATERDNLYKGYQKILSENQDLEVKNKNLEKELEGRKELYTALKKLMDTKYISIDEHNNIVDPLNKEIERLNRYTANVDKVNHDLVSKVTLLESEKEENEKLNEEVKNLKNSVESWVNEYNHVKCQYETEMVEGYNNMAKINRLTAEIEKLKKERDKYMARANDLRMELDCVKASKEKHEEAAHEKVVEDLRENIKYWRTKYLATQEERDVIHKELEELKKNKEDDHGKSGFTEYIKYIIEEEEGKFKKELNERFSEEVSKISQKRTKEELAKAKLNEKFGVGGIVDEFKEETEVKGVGRTNSGRYPWGAKVNDIPCGEDAIE